MHTHGKFRALFATMRVANLPSVVSNVWVGTVVGILLFQSDPNRPDITPVPWAPALLLAAGACCLYLGGCFLNDWKDVDWDLRNRAERALPRRMFPRGSYLAAALACLLGGGALAFLASPLTLPAVLFIVGCIAIYTWIHKRTVWSVVPMGMCRGALPLLGTLAFASPGQSLAGALWLAAFPGCGLLFYTMALSIRARNESRQTTARDSDASTVLFVVAVLCLLVPTAIGQALWLILVAPVPMIAWYGYCGSKLRTPVPRYVSGLLAGFPLLDWMLLLPLALSSLEWNTPRLLWDDPLTLSMFFVPPVAFVSALLLQRLAPAT